MFYKSEIKDHIRVPPVLFNLTREQAVLKQLKSEYEGYISKDIGIVIDVPNIKEIKEGIVIPGDGASYYETVFELLTFKPELQEVVMGRIKDIADFGAFISLGPLEGMIHISQTMDDFVSFAKDKVLTGKETKRTLKVGDLCKARIIAVSFKDVTAPKLGLTMRQPSLGKIDWIEEEEKKQEEVEEEAKEEKKEEKPAKEKKKEKKKGK
jgi:DNA-directed RNA polymerase subunit E'